MFVAAVSILALAVSVAVLITITTQGRFKRRRATIVALTAAISRLEAVRTDPARRSRLLAAGAVAAGPNVFALDDYRRLRSDRRRATGSMPTLFEAVPRSRA
jgi:hypothetical protein